MRFEALDSGAGRWGTVRPDSNADGYQLQLASKKIRPKILNVDPKWF